MRFDDRLLTVLNQPAEDRHDAAVRWRQLVDLVARAGANSSSPAVDEALDAIKAEADRVDENLRAAAARAVAALPLPIGLLEVFARDRLAVSAPVLAAASLEPAEWALLRTAADEETRQFIETLHPQSSIRDRSVDEFPALIETDAPDTDAAYSPPSLHEVVERIERRRQYRAQQVHPDPLPAAATTWQEPPSLFRWECGPGGEIAWVEGAPRGALVGRSIARPTDGEGVDREIVRAFSMRAPFRDASMHMGGGMLAGQWKISGVPAFEPVDGRFAGYRGVALREAPSGAPVQDPGEMPDVLADPDSLRELVHEIKTPLNAIIGFAEIIEGQYLGPADRGYRDRASEIVRQARLLLAAIDDLDFAAKVHSGRGGVQERVDLGLLVDRAIDELRSVAARHGARIEALPNLRKVNALVEPELADRLLIRLFTTIAERAQRGEQLHVAVEHSGGAAQISVSRPEALKGLSDKDLFDPAPGRDGVRGGFSLRLARGLARIAGGDLASGRDAFALKFKSA